MRGLRGGRSWTKLEQIGPLPLALPRSARLPSAPALTSARGSYSRTPFSKCIALSVPPGEGNQTGDPQHAGVGVSTAASERDRDRDARKLLAKVRSFIKCVVFAVMPILQMRKRGSVEFIDVTYEVPNQIFGGQPPLHFCVKEENENVWLGVKMRGVEVPRGHRGLGTSGHRPNSFLLPVEYSESRRQKVVT